jgi:hypothetical protein
MAFTAVANWVVGAVSTYATVGAAFAAGAYAVAALGALGAIGAAYVTSRVINGNPNKGNNSARNEGGRIQVAPATNNKIPVIYGNAYVNGMITDAKLTTLDQKDNNVMFYCIVLGETTNNINTTYGLESVYWNDLRLTALSSTSTESHVVKDGRKVVEGAIVTAGSFVVGKTYVITKLGTTTQAQWNTIAGTSGRAYGVGSVFEAATTGASSGNGQAQVEDFIDENFIVGTNQYVSMRVYAGGSTAANQIFPTNSNNKANAYNFWGSTPQNPNGDGSWTSANEMKGLVFAIIKLRYGGDKGFTSLPNVTFQIANNVTNPADVWLDYMTSKRYGAGIDSSYIDETARLAWYNFCEEDISYTSVNLDPQGGAGTTNQLTSRYSINGVIDTSNQVKTNIDTILQNGGAWMSYNVDTGLWSPIIKKAVSAGIAGDSTTYFTASKSGTTLTVATFPSGRIEAGQRLYNSTNTLIGTITAQLTPTGSETAGQIGRYTVSGASSTITTTTFYTLPASTLEFSDDNIISGISISSTRLEDLYNQVEVEFYNKYNKDQKAYFRNNLDQEDRNPNEPDNQLRMSLDLCNNSPQADIIGQMELRQSRDDLVIEFTSTHYGIQAQGGDVIAVTSELYGWYPKYFRVMRVKEIEGDDGSLVANIQALEYNPDAYTVEPITEFSTASNIGIGVWGTSPNLPLPPAVVIASVDADAPIPNFELQITVPASGGPFDEIELYYHEGWDQHPITGSIVPGTGSNGAPVGKGLLTVTAATYGNINAGDRIDLLAPAADIFIVSQLTNSPASKTFVSGGVPASTTSTLLTLNNVTGLKIGNTLTGTGIENGSFIIDIDTGTNTVRIEDAVTAQAAGTYTVTGGLGTYIVDTSTTISGTADLYDFPEADNYKPLKKIVPSGNDPTFTNNQVVRDVVTNVPANSATYRRWFVIARMGIKKQFGTFSEPGETDFETGRFPYDPNPTAAGALSDLTDVSITSLNEGQTLYYDATTSKWKNNSILEVSDATTFGGIVVGEGITQPMISFPRQADGVNAMYGIRGISADTDPWFVGAGSTGIDSGYLEIATGDNTGDPMGTGSPIYVRQYDGYSGGASVPWYGGTGSVVNQLTLLDEDGNTIIPNNLTVDSGTLFVNATTHRVGIKNTSPAYELDVTGSAYVSDDLTVNGGNININGTATLAVQPYITFATQADGNNPLYGIRGMSTVDDPWFIGAGSIGDDGGYLEIATGDNTNGSNTGGEIYVRQYNGQGAGGAPWYGGSGTIQNSLTLLDNFGYTSIPKRLGINNTSPLYALDVNGVGNIETSLTVPSITTLTGDDLSISAFSGRDVTISTTAAADPVTIVRNSGNYQTAIRTLTLRANTTSANAPVVGYGNSLEFETESTPGTFAQSGYIETISTAANAGVLDTFKMNFGLLNAGSSAPKMELDSLGNLQIDGNLQVDGNNIKKSGGTTVVTFSGTNLTTFAGDIVIGGNTIRDSASTPAIELSGADASIYGNLTVTGNNIKSNTATALTLSGANVTVAGTLELDGNIIKANDGTTALTLSASTGNVTVAGNLTVSGDVIKKSGGNTVLTFSSTNLVTTAGDIEVGGGDIRSPGGAIAMSLSGSDVAVAGNLTVTGGSIKSSSATAITLSGDDVTVVGDLTLTNNTIKSSTATAITLTGNDVAIGGELDVNGTGLSTIDGSLYLAGSFERNRVIQYTNDYTATLSTANQVIDSWSTATYRNAKYTIQVAFIYDAVGPKYYYKSIDISVIAKHDNSAAFIVTSNELDTVGFNLSTFSVAMSGTTLQLRASPYSTSFLGAKYRIDATLMETI